MTELGTTKTWAWARHVALAVTLAIVTHALTVWAVPRLIMDRIIALGSTDAVMERSNGVSLPPPTDHTQRRIVMPSPDLLYATCFFDVSESPARVTLQTDYPRYWSIALYASTSDNFFVVNDRGVRDGRVDLTIVDARHSTETFVGENEETLRVVSPTDRGMLLMRLLVNDDPSVRAAAESARRNLRCTN